MQFKITTSSLEYCMLVYLGICLSAINGTCLREQSRVVRRIVMQEIIAVYAKFDEVDIPRLCPFHPERDIFLGQENHKTMETISRWVCEYCGKAFTAEVFLDRHFHNRHPNKLNEVADKVCLSDYCDIFRCEVASTKSKADFWEVALCIEDDLKELRQNCEMTMDMCVPVSGPKNITSAIREMLLQGVCSYLTCHSYWEKPFVEGSQTETILYVMACVLVLFVLIMYYCVVLNYYYSDEWDTTQYDWSHHSPEQMLWRPRDHYDPDLAAQYRPRITATRRKALHSPAQS